MHETFLYFNYFFKIKEGVHKNIKLLITTTSIIILYKLHFYLINRVVW